MEVRREDEEDFVEVGDTDIYPGSHVVLLYPLRTWAVPVERLILYATDYSNNEPQNVPTLALW